MHTPHLPIGFTGSEGPLLYLQDISMSWSGFNNHNFDALYHTIFPRRRCSQDGYVIRPSPTENDRHLLHPRLHAMYNVD